MYMDAGIGWMLLPLTRCKHFKEMDASLVGVPVFKTVCVALILSQVGSIPTHLRHFNLKTYITDIIGEIVSSISALVHLFWYTFLFKLLDIPE